MTDYWASRPALIGKVDKKLNDGHIQTRSEQLIVCLCQLNTSCLFDRRASNGLHVRMFQGFQVPINITYAYIYNNGLTKSWIKNE